MIVCLCHGVSDKEIRAAVRRGIRSAEAIGLDCGAGTGCGACRETVEQLLADPAQGSREGAGCSSSLVQLHAQHAG